MILKNALFILPFQLRVTSQGIVVRMEENFAARNSLNQHQQKYFIKIELNLF